MSVENTLGQRPPELPPVSCMLSPSSSTGTAARYILSNSMQSICNLSISFPCQTASSIFSSLNREKYLVCSSSGIVLFVVFSFGLYPLWLFLVLNLITSHFCTTELNKLLTQALSWIYPDHFAFICSVPLYLLYPPFSILCHWQI